MRKLTSFLFMSLDGVVEAPHVFVRPELYEAFPALIGETIAEQDAVLIVCPVLAGGGRRLLPDGHAPLQLELVSARSTPSGLQYLVCLPR